MARFDRAHPLQDRGRERPERHLSESLADLGCPLGRLDCGVERGDGFLTQPLEICVSVAHRPRPS
jgi:hypothetical protein